MCGLPVGMPVGMPNFKCPTLLRDVQINATIRVLQMLPGLEDR
jgi:hypothetical protein